jgi:hypothetical protein
MDTNTFPPTIYQTHDNWGETLFADEPIMHEIIDDLHNLGEDWQDCTISDCAEFSFVKTDAVYGIFKRLNCRHNEWIVFEHSDQSGYYRITRIGSHPAQYFDSDEIVEDFPGLAVPKRGGTAPNASLILTADELAFIDKHFKGSKSAAIHAALAALAALKRSE